MLIVELMKKFPHIKEEHLKVISDKILLSRKANLPINADTINLTLASICESGLADGSQGFKKLINHRLSTVLKIVLTGFEICAEGKISV
jgi:hypothetical protein